MHSDEVHSPHSKRLRPSGSLVLAHKPSSTQLPVASSMDVYFTPNGPKKYRPDKAWFSPSPSSGSPRGGGGGDGVVLESMVLGNGEAAAGGGSPSGPNVNVSLYFEQNTNPFMGIPPPPAPGMSSATTSSSRRGSRKATEHPLHRCGRLNLHVHLRTILSDFPQVRCSEGRLERSDSKSPPTH